MVAYPVENPYAPFVGLEGRGINSGDLYIGVEGADPQTSPQACFWDAAGSIPAAQPIDIMGGYPMRAGTPARLFTARTYSMRLRDRLTSQVFYLPVAGPPDISSDDVEYLRPDAGAVARTVTDKLDDWVSVLDFGADPTGVANCDDAFAAAIATDKAVYVPDGEYKITTPIDLGSAADDTVVANKLFGAGIGNATIVQYTNDVPIVKLGGPFGFLRDIRLIYNTFQTTSGASAVEFYAFRWGAIERVSVINANKGFEIKQAAIYGGDNFISNVNMMSVYIDAFNASAMELIAFSGGCGGVSMTNIYATSRFPNGAARSVDTVYVFGSFSDFVVNVMHAEGMECDEVIYAYSGDNCSISALHIEAVTAKQDSGGLVHLDGQFLDLSGMLVFNCTFPIATLPTAYHLFRLEVGSVLIVRNVVERGSTITTPLARQFSVTGGDNAIYSNTLRCSGFTDPGNFATPYEYRQRGHVMVPLVAGPLPDVGDASVTLVPGNSRMTQRWNTPLTANRTAALSTTNAWEGITFRAVRTAAATGGFTLSIGGLKNLAPGEWCDVTYSFGGWLLTAFGTL